MLLAGADGTGKAQTADHAPDIFKAIKLPY